MATVGIDFGTANITVAVWENGSPRVIPNVTGANSTPAIIVRHQGEDTFGEDARAQSKSLPQNVVFEFSQFIGLHDYKAVEETIYEGYYPFNEIDSKHGHLRFNLPNGERLYLVHIVQEFLRQAKELADNALGRRVVLCVITVPCTWTDLERTFLEEAAMAAGFERVFLVDAAAAALIGCFLHTLDPRASPRTIMVVDVGASATTAAVFPVESERNKGSSVLYSMEPGGGSAVDRAMAKHCFTEFCAQNGVDSALDMGEIHRLRLECEDAKKNLATRKVTEVAVSNFRDDMDLQCRMDHELFRRINGEVIARTLQLLQRTVETMRGKGGLGDDYQLLLLGGGSRNVALREAVCQKFESSVNRSVLLYPEVAAAFGAAGLADILAVVPECESLLDARQIAQHYRHLAKALLDAEPSSERFLELARYAKSFVAAKSNVPSPSEWTALQRKVSLSNSNSSKGILKPRPLDDLQGMARVTVRKWQQNGHSSVPSDGEVDIGESDDEEIKPDKPEQGVRCRGFANGPANGGVKVSNRSYSSRVSNGSQSPTDVDCSGVTILRRPDIVKLCVGENDHDDDDDDDWDKTVQDGTCHNYFGGLARGPADPGGRGSSQSSSSRLSNRSQSPSELGNSEGAAVGRSTEAGLEHQWRHRPPKPHDDFAAVIRVDSMNNQRPPAFFKKADRVPRKKSSGGKRRIRGSEKCQIA